MREFTLFDEKVNSEFLVDADACKGLKRVAQKVIKDFVTITGASKKLTEVKGQLDTDAPVVFAGIAGESKVLDKLEKAGKISLSDVTGKWEVYKYTIVDKALVIAGSDKLGAIYGLFNLSELCGVSPLVWIADGNIPTKKVLKVNIDEKVTKEPSVKFRGLFINDEWPCFGNWAFMHYDGVNAKLYDNVFELLLRLKGNYMWPAMWASCFALEGPGLEAYELATEYGIYIGNSHHEPCLRAGEEYRKMRGKDSPYGDAWNFRTNKEGITNFWRDSLMERGGFDSIVTVGMRGEADSKILGESATLKDNIDLLKDVITCQKSLLKETEEKYNKKFPKLLALYKEVEPFYYGDENTEGLCDWSELDDVILMLCEDNYGYLRTVPDDKMQKHPAGFGMYYHVDYHGAPISYEWINSSPLTTMWEQMSQAYDYGVRSVWILNVGDLKHNEFPLSYFLNLAYDFDKWGTSAPNTTFEYTKDLISKHLGSNLSKEQVTNGAEILTETVRLSGLRRPEALNENIFNPSHFEEADRMLDRVKNLEIALTDFEAALTENQASAWYSLTGFQTRALINLYRLHLYGAKNNYFAKLGLKQANDYAELVTKAIAYDKALKQEFSEFNDYEWKGHELASHIGFTKWNEDGSRYPLRMQVEPFDRPRLFVSRVDGDAIYDKVYGPAMKLTADDFCYSGCKTLKIRLSNAGSGSLHAKLTIPETDWLTADFTEGDIAKEEIVTFTCDRTKLTKDTVEVQCRVTDGDTTVLIEIDARHSISDDHELSFLPTKFGYAINAKDCDSDAPDGFEWTELKDYGVYESAMKVFPVNRPFTKGKEPELSLKIFVEEEGDYTLQTDFAPTNPLSRENELKYKLLINNKEAGTFNTVPKGYKSGEGSDAVWSEGALTHRRKCLNTVLLTEGINKITVKILDQGLVPERFFIYRENPPKSYLGMNLSVKK